MAELTLGSLNLHMGRGTGGHDAPFYDVVTACKEIDTDVLVLQEGWVPDDAEGDVLAVAGALGYSVAATFAERAYPGGLTYSGHPLACASAVASMQAFEDDGILAHVGVLEREVWGPGLAELAAEHPSVGEVRGIGCFWAVELVRDPATREPLVPYNAAGASAAPMAELVAACKAGGLWPFTHFNRLHVVPPLVISADDARLLLGILDTALDVADAHVA